MITHLKHIFPVKPYIRNLTLWRKYTSRTICIHFKTWSLQTRKATRCLNNSFTYCSGLLPKPFGNLVILVLLSWVLYMSSDYTDYDWNLRWKRCNKGRCIHNVVTKEKMDTCMGHKPHTSWKASGNIWNYLKYNESPLWQIAMPPDTFK